MEYDLAAARAYPSGDKERLRLAADWLTLLFNYDDLLDESTSDLTHNESGASEASKIMLSVLLDTDNFQPTSSLPVAATFHRYIWLIHAFQCFVACQNLADLDGHGSLWTRFRASSSLSTQK